mmetsp:Transcript_22526/g.53170  ORF Transcript_22526/g.53170 Transcript_22526/m.53170 type:complete len:799 (+) Transcript_22526:318-2714(+)|eukprot:CAMPEP_0172385676 /NCGR_PEP_ID=MMETSP1061-20121228/3291_1 /TAXON_ID=37318 /ORGANISM="Pseudo-nitzschia pungens, Strain cf. pungens" /LENGTH=798 /DNA_ID=CAMNT_0013114767 /DNA_START=242 /DNA_END=2638 /DNA_ORIENTATION=-
MTQKQDQSATGVTDDTNNMDELIEDLIHIKSSLQLKPKSPEKCPVFCCFYAEFDIKTGPVVRYQSPENFMDKDINTTTAEIHGILEKTFEGYKNKQTSKKEQEKKITQDDVGKTNNDSNAVPVSVNSSPGEAFTVKTTISKPKHHQHLPLGESPPSKSRSGEDDRTNTEKFSDGDSVKGRDNGTSPVDAIPPEGGQSFFDSTSEYIITGSELTGKIITLSTHDVHVMTRPTQIANERYERNALLFSIGIVLRRAADPRPFRPLISKLATTLRSMEIETGVLSDQRKVNRILQPLLEQILISMNSPRWECNLLLDRSTALNLKLFHPPKPPASPVHEYQVPVLLVRDFQLGYYEWDLAINWVILHIDGITNARQISVKAEVDLEMVLACLRVLRHHCVIKVIDMFVYTNRYECTERAAAMLAGKQDKLLQEAVEFAMKRHKAVQLVPPPVPSPRTVPAFGSGSKDATGGSDVGHTPSSPKSGSPYYYTNSSVRSHGTNPSSSFPPRSLNLFGAGGGSQRSTHFRHAMMVASSLEREQKFLLGGGQRPSEHRKHLKSALAELYCACNRNLSFGDLWLSLTTELPTSLVVPIVNKTSSGHRGAGLSSNFQRSVGTRKDSLTEYDMSENEVVAFSPMEASYLESLRHRSSTLDDKGNSNNNNNGKASLSSSGISPPTNWNEIFKEFDHRRFVTFGVVNGLLTRVHSYPFFHGPFPDKRKHVSIYDSSSSQAMPPESARLLRKRELTEEKNFQFAKSVSEMMDGTMFDDELVCMFERPFNVLVELVEKYSGKKVAQIFARGSN